MTDPMHTAAAAQLQPCPTLRDPRDCSPPGSSAHGIFQARVPEWGAIAFSSIHTKKMKKGRYEPLSHLRHRDCEQSNKIDRGMKNFPINKTLGSLSGKESACQCRRGGFDSWFGKTPHAMGQLSLCTTTTEPVSRAWELQLLSPGTTTTEVHVPRARALRQKATAMRSSPTLQLAGSPNSLQLERSPTLQRRSSETKNIYVKSLKKKTTTKILGPPK